MGDVMGWDFPSSVGKDGFLDSVCLPRCMLIKPEDASCVNEKGGSHNPIVVALDKYIDY